MEGAGCRVYLGYCRVGPSLFRHPLPILCSWRSTIAKRWASRLVDLAEIGHELWVGDAAQIRASYVRQQKTTRSPGLEKRETWGTRPTRISTMQVSLKEVIHA